MAKATQGQLGKNLIGALQRSGLEGAISFCNTRALQITDSMAQVQKARIQRVSDKPRNPVNMANEDEVSLINKYKQALVDGSQLEPAVHHREGQKTFYFPIMTNAMCLQCHGIPDQELLPATLSKIKTFYPDDQAIGYQANQVRGLWKVQLAQE